MDETQAANSVRVKIYNHDYVLCTDGDPEYLKELCAALDERMLYLANTTRVADTTKLAVLAALSLVDDVCRAREATKKLDEVIGRRSIACASIIDDSRGNL